MDLVNQALKVTRDPLNLDSTSFARQLREGKNPATHKHPLRKNEAVSAVLEVIARMDQQLNIVRSMTPEQCVHDPYFQHTPKGIEFRPEVVLAFAVNLLRQHPNLLENKKARRQKLHHQAKKTFFHSHETLYGLYPNQWVAYLGESMLAIVNHNREELKERYRSEYRGILRETGYTIEDIVFFKVSDPKKKKSKRHKK